MGKQFLSQLHHVQQAYPQLSLVLISRSKQTLFMEDFNHTISPSNYADSLEKSNQPVLPPEELLFYLKSAPDGHAVIVDNTSSQTIADSYPVFLKAGISIVTPNKKGFSADRGLWRDIFAAASNSPGTQTSPEGGLIYHESSVGAGLPIISTLNDLVATGDKILKIEGIFSGTMSFLFNNFAPAASSASEAGGPKWSEIVKKAQAAGYTEPDPRDDLNGQDVARKLVILGRLAGLEIQSTDSFPVESLIPGDLESSESGEDFLNRLGEFDGEMKKVKEAAERDGKVVRYVGSVDCVIGDVRVGLERFEKSHPFAALQGSDNIISFRTERYKDTPLIVQGAGWVFSCRIRLSVMS